MADKAAKSQPPFSAHFAEPKRPCSQRVRLQAGLDRIESMFLRGEPMPLETKKLSAARYRPRSESIVGALAASSRQAAIGVS
jgi:hypothetical protein